MRKNEVAVAGGHRGAGLRCIRGGAATRLGMGIVVVALASVVIAPSLLVGGGAAAAGPPAVLSAPPLAPQAIDGLKVMSFNIRYGTARDGDNEWELRRGAVIELIDTMRADVLGVQEALRFQLDELAGAMPRYREIGVGRTDGVETGEYAAILIDSLRLEVLDEGTFWFSDTPEVPGSTSWGNDITRICTWARLRDHESDRTFYLYNVHWDHQSQQSRERSAELLVERIAQRTSGADPVLVTGDFNAGESNAAFRRLVEAPGVGLFDTFRALHPAAQEVGTFNGFEGTSTGEKIDAVLASGDWDVLESRIVRDAPQNRYPSDHFPVMAVVRLRPPVGR